MDLDDLRKRLANGELEARAGDLRDAEAKPASATGLKLNKMKRQRSPAPRFVMGVDLSEGGDETVVAVLHEGEDGSWSMEEWFRRAELERPNSCWSVPPCGSCPRCQLGQAMHWGAVAVETNEDAVRRIHDRATRRRHDDVSATGLAADIALDELSDAVSKADPGATVGKPRRHLPSDLEEGGAFPPATRL
jgi:hypothetical protein